MICACSNGGANTDTVISTLVLAPSPFGAFSYGLRQKGIAASENSWSTTLNVYYCRKGLAPRLDQFSPQGGFATTPKSILFEAFLSREQSLTHLAPYLKMGPFRNECGIETERLVVVQTMLRRSWPTSCPCCYFDISPLSQILFLSQSLVCKMLGWFVKR
jgi:hypothetical protein